MAAAGCSGIAAARLAARAAAGFDTGMKSLAVRVLGDFSVDGIEPRAIGSRKARLALRLLALGNGEAVPSDVLIDALWADRLPGRPDDQLAVLVSRLRSVLGRDRIEHRDGGYLAWRRATRTARRPGWRRQRCCCVATWCSAGASRSSTSW
jgi:DNA-binding response OmpR family regulator